MKAGLDQFQLIIRGKKSSINDKTIKSILSVTLYCITTDSKLKFREHIHNHIQKTCYVLYGLRRPNLLTLEKSKILSTSITESQLQLPIVSYYCPLTWMFCSKAEISEKLARLSTIVNYQLHILIF